MGRVADGRAALGDAEHEAERNRLRVSRSTALLIAAGLALAEGRFAAATHLTHEALDAAGGQQLLFHLVHTAQMTANLLEQGRIDHVVHTIRSFESSDFDIPAWNAMLACCLADDGATREAAALLSRLSDHEQTGYHRDFSAPLSIRHLSETCRHVGDAQQAAQRLLPNVAAWRGQLLYLVFVCTVEGAADRSLGHVLATLGRLEEADAAYTRAASLERTSGFASLLARTQYWHARCLIQRGERVDIRRAQTLLDETIDIADRLGMRKIAEQARANLRVLN